MPPGGESRALVLRLTLCLVTATVISVTAYICAWLSYRDYHYFRFESYMTRESLERLREEIAHHQEKTGGLPPSLADLDVLKKQGFPVDEVGRPVDWWERPFRYQVAGDTYDLYSLGRDGQPGGLGLDADLHAGRADPATEQLTLWQFTTDADTGGIQLTCVLAGILAIPLCLLGIKREGTDHLSPIRVLVVNGTTVVFAILAAVVIGGLHLPSGH